MLDIYEERDINCLFHALSRTAFGFSDFHKGIKEQVVVYMVLNRERFSVRKNNFEGYLILL